VAAAETPIILEAPATFIPGLALVLKVADPKRRRTGLVDDPTLTVPEQPANVPWKAVASTIPPVAGRAMTAALILTQGSAPANWSAYCVLFKLESVVAPVTPSVPVIETFPLKAVPFKVLGIMAAVSPQYDGSVVLPVQFANTVLANCGPKSGPTMFLHIGIPLPPLGAAKIVLADCEARLKVHTPDAVIGPHVLGVRSRAGTFTVSEVTVPPLASTR